MLLQFGFAHKKRWLETSIACKVFRNHTNFTINDSGLIINPSCPHLGATPDGKISCECCGTGCLEIKCPYCKRNNDLSDPPTCLITDSSGQLSINKSHSYYYQVQCQMNVGGFEYCDFIVWTTVDLHVERIECNSQFFNEKLTLANEFFTVAILPELVSKFYSRKPLQTLTDVRQSNTCTDVNITNNNEFEAWCYCRKSFDSELIGCDNENCSVQWYHFECVGVKIKPRGKWYCPECRKLPQFKRGKGTKLSK